MLSQRRILLIGIWFTFLSQSWTYPAGSNVNDKNQQNYNHHLDTQYWRELTNQINNLVEEDRTQMNLLQRLIMLDTNNCPDCQKIKQVNKNYLPTNKDQHRVANQQQHKWLEYTPNMHMIPSEQSQPIDPQIEQILNKLEQDEQQLLAEIYNSIMGKAAAEIISKHREESKNKPSSYQKVLKCKKIKKRPRTKSSENRPPTSTTKYTTTADGSSTKDVDIKCSKGYIYTIKHPSNIRDDELRRIMRVIEKEVCK